VPTLICDLHGLVQDVDHEAVLDRLRAANGGEVELDSARELRDEAFESFRCGVIGENEYARHLRARLGWRGSDADLVHALAGLYAAIDLGVMEVLLDLRRSGWFLIGLDHQAGAATGTHGRWGGEYAEQLGIFHRVLSPGVLVGGGSGLSVQVPGQSRGTALGTTDPRFFARLRQEAPTAHGVRLLVTTGADVAAAARSQGFETHVFRGATALRSACMLSV
jgi:hypothetical protein